RVRLRVAGAPLLLAREDGRDEAALLGVGTEADDRRTDPEDTHAARRGRRVGARQLLLEDRLLHGGESSAAELLRPGGADEADGLECAVPAVHALAIPALRARRRVLGEPGAYARPEAFLLRRVAEVHPSGRSDRAPGVRYRRQRPTASANRRRSSGVWSGF